MEVQSFTDLAHGKNKVRHCTAYSGGWTTAWRRAGLCRHATGCEFVCLCVCVCFEGAGDYSCGLSQGPLLLHDSVQHGSSCHYAPTRLLCLARAHTHMLQMVSAVCWLPGWRMIACALADTPGVAAHTARTGRLHPGAILLWDTRDVLRPAAVLGSPHEVHSLAANPCSPGVLVGGCANGQVAMWSLQGGAAHANA